MAVDLLIKFKDAGREAELIPIAGQKSFDEHWMPASQELGLRWIPLFGALQINKDNVHDIVDELVKLEAFFGDVGVGRMNLPQDIVDHYISRIERLKSTLQDAQKNWNAIDELYI